MKITVITDQEGRILGTARQMRPSHEGQAAAGLIAGPGQTIRDIELPRQLEEIESPEALHAALEEHLASMRAES